MDAMTRKITVGSVGRVVIDGERVADLDFPDDVAHSADSWVDKIMVAIVRKMEQATHWFGVNKSVRKSEVMFIG